MIRRPPRSTLFPYTTLFRSLQPDLRQHQGRRVAAHDSRGLVGKLPGIERPQDRKSTRLNSSHLVISYAVFCLKKKKKSSTQSRDYPYTTSNTVPSHTRVSPS